MKSNKQTKVKAVPAKPAAVDVDADSAQTGPNKRQVREAEASQIKVTDAVDAIIDNVDRCFLSALPAPNVWPSEWVTDECSGIEELFRTTEARDSEEFVSEVLDKIAAANPPGKGKDILQSAILDLKYSLNRYHMAIGFAAGLRATGTPTPTARALMLGLLRNYTGEYDELRP